MLYIPTKLKPVSEEESARLLEKTWRARVWMKSNPFARAMNARLKCHLKRVATVTDLKC